MPSNFLASLARHGQPHAPAYSPATGNGAQAALAAAGRSALTTRAALLAFMIGLAAMFAAQDFPRHWADSASYISMAQGLPALMPWAARILLPDIVAFLSMTLGVGMDHAFEVMTCLAFIVWISTVAEEWRPSAWLPLFLVTPLVVASLQAVYITDMFHMGLTALFFLLLRRNIFLAAGFMVILVLCRESSMFLAFVSAGFLLWNRNWLGAVAMLAGYFVGSAIVHHATAGVQNVHHMPELMYLVTKIPANFLRDWVGVLLWTNGYAWCDQPVFSVVLPGGMHLGAITQIGFCAPSIAAPLSTASAYVTIFGWQMARGMVGDRFRLWRRDGRAWATCRGAGGQGNWLRMAASVHRPAGDMHPDDGLEDRRPARPCGVVAAVAQRPAGGAGQRTFVHRHRRVDGGRRPKPADWRCRECRGLQGDAIRARAGGGDRDVRLRASEGPVVRQARKPRCIA